MITRPRPFILFQYLAFALFLSGAIRLTAGPMTWDVPVQPAADALLAFSNQSGYQVLFSATEMAGVKSQAVKGEHEPMEALRLLLVGTNFEAVSTKDRRVVVRARPYSLITGVVLGGPNGTPLGGATVAIEELNLSTVTGKTGRFRLARIPAGTYTVVISAGGLQPVRIAGLVLEPGSNVELKPVTFESAGGASRDVIGADGVAESSPLIRLEDRVVTPSRFGVSEGPSAANATLTHEDLERLPQLGEDLYRAIGRLPGLATLDYSAKFWVRGAPNEQVLARFDGLTLLEPYHIKDVDGALAIIDIETVSRLDLISGGFTAEYGDRLAGVLQMETATHTAARPRTTLGLSLTGLRATNRGTFAGGKGSWMMSGRMGYPDIAIDAANGSDNNSKTRIRYYDLFGKIEYSPVPGQVFGLHVLQADDTFSVHETNRRDLTNSYGNSHVWARWRADFSSELKGETVLGYSALDWHRRGEGFIDATLPFAIRDDRDLELFSLRSDWSMPQGDSALFRGGFELQGGSAGYLYHQLRSENVVRNGVHLVEGRVLDRNPAPEGMNNGAYAAWRFQPHRRVTLEPGLRYDWSDYGAADGGFSPRFNAAFDLGRATLRAAWGRYRQQQGLHEINVVDGESIIHPAERAEHRVLGLETKLGRRAKFRAEVYQRITSNPRPHGENLIELSDELGEILFDRVLLRPTHAKAHGVELTVESRGQNRFDWAFSYALAKTVETINGREVPRSRDQRHTFGADFSYRPNPRWQFTTSWQYHTGWPGTAEIFTKMTLQGGIEVINLTFGPINGERLPAYHRLDFRATRIWKLRHGTLRTFVDVFNAYDRPNVEYYRSIVDRSGGQFNVHRFSESLLPILPSVGIIWDF